MLYDLTHDMDNRDARLRVTVAYEQALAYVWGRQDAGEGERDTDLSEKFALAFGQHVKDFILERSFWKTNLQSAYMSWRDTGTISV